MKSWTKTGTSAEDAERTKSGRGKIVYFVQQKTPTKMFSVWGLFGSLVHSPKALVSGMQQLLLCTIWFQWSVVSRSSTWRFNALKSGQHSVADCTVEGALSSQWPPNISLAYYWCPRTDCLWGDGVGVWDIRRACMCTGKHPPVTWLGNIPTLTC